MADPPLFSEAWCEAAQPRECEPLFSCQGPNASAVIWGYVMILVLLFIASAVFLRLKRGAVAQPGDLAKKLTFHSTDDAPRDFAQTGYKFSILGALLLYSWISLFIAGYIVVMLMSVWVYAKPYDPVTETCPGGGFLWFKCMPMVFQQLLHPCHQYSGSRWDFPSFMGPYCIVFTGTHLLWLVLSLTWETLRVSFMSPAGTLGKDATLVLIEEVLSFDTDNDLIDPDAGFMGKVEGAFRSISARFSAPSTRTVVAVETAKDGTRSIEYTCVRYSYDSETQRFRPKGIVQYTPMELHSLLEQGGLSAREAAEQQRECGKNEISVYVPGVLEALVAEFSHFTYVFNSIGTWSYMVYSVWNIGIFWLIMTISSGVYRSLGIVRPNQKKISTLAQLRGTSTVLRDGKWVQKDVSDIVLGDIIRIDGNSTKLPCDGIIVQGSLVVNESMLTGEPMPIQKVPVDKSENAAVSKKNVAYSGTECMQSVGPSEGLAVMVATSVGALTTRGQLVRMVLFPTSVRFRYNDQMPLVYAIICLYMVFLAAIYISPFMDLGDWVAKFMFLINTVAKCLSPMLPVSLVMGQANAAARLQKDHEINCLQPGRIPIAGKMSTIVFDKTGTITKDGMDFDSIIPATDANSLGSPISIDPDNPAENPGKIEREVPQLLRYALAACHTVTTLPDGTFVGNAVEVAMVTAAGWTILEDKVTSPTGTMTLPLAKKLDFDHERMTSGVIVRTEDKLIVYIKGSYEKIQAISKPEAVPHNYGSTTERCAKDGYYVLGIATKDLPLSAADQLVDMTRDEIEDGLSVCGLLLFRNDMKKDSPQAIAKLKAGGIRSVICTGDNALTGISIGRQCHIVTTEKVLLGEKSQSGHIEWRDPDSDLEHCDIFAPEFAERNLAMTQYAWRYFHSRPAELEKIWTRVTVFARMKPEDKINVVKYFQGRGLIVGMAGDGGNDCGGLRAAHAGLALSDAEASMVSPFSTGRDGKSLLTMVDLVREGRACLATNIGTFTYFMVYCFVLTTLYTIMQLVSALNFGEFSWFFMDVAINIGLVGAMTVSGPTEELGKYRPTATLLGSRTMAGIWYPYFSCLLFFLFTAEVIVTRQDFYTETGGRYHAINDINLSPSAWMLRADNYVSPVALAFVFLTLITTGFVNTYGGEFRASVLVNRRMLMFYGSFTIFTFFLILTPPVRLSCIFRMNCDTDTSLTTGGLETDSPANRWIWEGLAFWSSAGLGDCFMGPQVRLLQDEWEAWFNETTQHLPDPERVYRLETTDGIQIVRHWNPDNRADRGRCYPYYLQEKNWTHLQAPSAPKPAPPLVFTEKASELVSTNQCGGSNNCYTTSFKAILSVLLLAHIVGHHLFVKFVLHGSLVDKWRKEKEEVELQQTGKVAAGSPLLLS